MHTATYAGFMDELTKIAFDRKKFMEGVKDEGIPLAGATAGAALGGIRGSAMGYAAGGLAQLGINHLQHRNDPKKQKSLASRVLGASALGYGAGGLAHMGAEYATRNLAKRNPRALAARMFHGGEHSRLARGMEEALPALGATTATGLAMGTSKQKTSGAIARMLGLEAKIIRDPRKFAVASRPKKLVAPPQQFARSGPQIDVPGWGMGRQVSGAFAG